MPNPAAWMDGLWARETVRYSDTPLDATTGRMVWKRKGSDGTGGGGNGWGSI